MNKLADKHCKTCGLCDGTLCNTLFKELNINYELPDKLPQDYNGLRFTSDAADCALPIAIDSRSGCLYSCLYCLPPKTPILMMDGRYKNIEKLIVGDKVVSYNEINRDWETSTVEKVMSRNSPKELISIELESGNTLNLTEEHPVYTKRGWVEAGQLLATDEILYWGI